MLAAMNKRAIGTAVELEELIAVRYIKGKKYCRSLTGLRPDSNSESPTGPLPVGQCIDCFHGGTAGMLRCADMRSFRRATKDLCNLFLPVLF